MKTKAIIDNFLYKIEFFYRNFGNEWSISDFTQHEKQKNVIKEFLPFLEKKGIIEIVSEEKFKIIDLPSNRL